MQRDVDEWWTELRYPEEACAQERRRLPRRLSPVSALASGLPVARVGDSRIGGTEFRRNAVGMNHPMEMMWGCVVLALIAAGLVASGLGGGYFLLIIPCMIMMAMMIRMMSGTDRRNQKKG